MNSDPPTDSQERLTALWTGAYRSVAAYVGSFITDSHAAEDVMQKIAITAVRKFPQFDESRPFVAWVIGIAKFELMKERRRFARERLVFDEDLIERITDSFQRQAHDLDERRTALRRCITRLDQRAREMIEERYLENLSPRDIARRRNRSPESVRMALMRIRQALRLCIEKHLSGSGV